MKINNILVPIDFSGCSINALRFAIEAAHQLKARLHLFHAYHIPIPVAEMTLAMDAKIVEDFQAKVETNYAELKEEIPSVTEVTDSFEIEFAFAIDAILKRAKQGVDLVIMGTKGATGLKEVLMGSLTADVISKSNIPILAIPEDAQSCKIKKIVFASDFDKVEDPSCWDIISAIVDGFSASLDLLHINPNLEATSVEKAEEAFHLDQHLKEIKHEFRFVVEKDVEKGINDYVSTNSIDLLILMPKKHGLFGKLFHKSITQKMTYHTHIPLMAFHCES